MTEEELRLECLKLLVGSGGLACSAVQAVTEAAVLEGFVLGRPQVTSCAQAPASGPAENTNGPAESTTVPVRDWRIAARNSCFMTAMSVLGTASVAGIVVVAGALAEAFVDGGCRDSEREWSRHLQLFANCAPKALPVGERIAWVREFLAAEAAVCRGAPAAVAAGAG